MRLNGTLLRDGGASIHVFLVALPLCLGIAAASGVPAMRGLETGIIGGILTGALAGAPMQVSGPSVGLVALVSGLMATRGISVLGPVVLVAGLVQMLIGVARIGAWRRFLPVALIEGVIVAVGLMQAAGQMRPMLGLKPVPGFFPAMLSLTRDLPHVNWLACLLGLLTITLTLMWEKIRPRALAFVPGSVPGVLAATALAVSLNVPVAHLAMPAGFGPFAMPGAGLLAVLRDPTLLASAFGIALFSSAESLMSVAALERMRLDASSAEYDRELMVQGLGNMLCGLIGALPMAGVVVRSAANLRAGAATRVSAVLHGVWLLAAVLLLPHMLAAIPAASLAAVLVAGGLRLASPAKLRAQAGEGGSALGTFAMTLATVLTANLLTGVLAGAAIWHTCRLTTRRAARAIA